MRKLIDGLRAFMAQLKPMTWPERLDHCWTYGKEYLWIAAVVIILLGAMVTTTLNWFRESVVTGIMVNLTIEQEGVNYLSSDFEEKIGIDGYWKEARMEYTAFSSMTAESQTEQNYYAAMTVYAEVAAKKLDYMILDKTGMEFYINQDVYMDLAEFFTEEEIAGFEAENRLIYAQEEDTDVRWIAAVDITNTAYIQDNLRSEGPIYFALAGNTEHKEACRDIWEHIHQWQPKEKETAPAA